MPCRENCGACCDPVWLSPEQVAKIQTFGPVWPDAAWMREHWTPVEEIGGHVAMRCDQYAPATRTCTAYADRPECCLGFPFYGREMVDHVVPNVCGYQAELGRTVLPIVGVS